MTELEASIGDNAVRVVVFSAPRGGGLTHALEAFVEEVRGWGHRAELTCAERVGIQAGGATDHLLRSRLGLDAATRGEALLQALDDRSPGLEPLAREFLSSCMGFVRPDFQVSRLDVRSRWEGAMGEVARWLSRGTGAFAWAIDDALALDADSLNLVTWLAQSADFPGLVVLAVRDDERGVFETRLKTLRSSGRLNDLHLPSLDVEAMHAAFPSSSRAAKSNPLVAQLLTSSSAESTQPLSLDAAVRIAQQKASSSEVDVLGVLAVGGGRLPLAALDFTLNAPQSEVVESLLRKHLIRRGVTSRCFGADEVWLRFPTQTIEPSPERAKLWLASLGEWAERQLLGADCGPAQRAFVLPMLIRAAEAAGDTARTSLAWELSVRSGSSAFGLRRAEASASGVRRLVLARMHAEDELFRGEAAQAAKTAQAAFRPGALAAVSHGPSAWNSVVLRDVTDELERWDRLTAEEANLALELARAEALSSLSQASDARRSFETVQSRLESLKKSPARDALWLRLAKTWSWFAAQMLADGELARRICATARARVGGDDVKRNSHALAFLRAEQVAHSRGGDSAQAHRLADELINVSRARGDAREECVAWNARALLSLRDGELSVARQGFEKSLDLARSIGFRRREAVAMHNLGLVLAYMGEYGASLACQDKYVQLSEQIGNHPARAYGPAAMAMVHVQQLDHQRAEPALARARKTAEENGWPGLIAWTRHLSGLSKLLRHLERKDGLQLSLARADFLACLDLLEDRKAGWSEELDPAETASFLALTWLCGGQHQHALTALPRARSYSSASPHSARVVFALEALLEKRAPIEAVSWFESNGYFRSTELWRRVAKYLDVPVPSSSEERTSL